MTINTVAAYARQGGATEGQGMGPRTQDPAKTFAELVGEAAATAVEAGHHSERMSALGLSGKADLNDVVTAVTSAEVTLQTVVAIRDRVIQAYQDIMRMPI